MQTVEIGARLALKRILFPTDFSSCAESALPYALTLARHYGSKLIFAHVLPPEPRPIIPHDAMPLAMDQSYCHGERAMDEFVRKYHLADVPHEVVLQKGELWDALSYILSKHEIDMIVLATHGRHGVRKLLLGSVAEEVFRRAVCPVMTVGPKLAPHPECDGEVKHILFATDFSAGSLHALRYAFSLAEENRAHLTLLHVLEQRPAVILETGAAADTGEHEERRVRVELENLLPAEDTYLWSNSDFVVEYGVVADSILRVAAERNTDLIVMGVRSAGRSVMHLPWATAHKVVAQALCPVLTVRG